jgi:pre-mRNA cleavage complex 2 protein Pcf11
MDWHFRMRTKSGDAERRGQYRSWYVDELDWISSREGPDDHVAATDGNPATRSSDAVSAADGAVSERSKEAEQIYLPVPEGTNKDCPICQERFETTWLDSVQDFVWMDAIRVGPRVFHASCSQEVSKAAAGAVAANSYGSGTSEPESVLGKRKVEEGEELLGSLLGRRVKLGVAT